PVIIARDYLTLYNFGFAAARGFPQLNEGLVQSMPITLRLVGNGHVDDYRARVVGFSSRLNTIAVPEEFMEWANARYSVGGTPDPSRLIIEANTPGDPAIAKYMEDNSYEIAGDKADNSRANYFMTVVTGIVITVGAVISVLAFFILMLSIYLLLQKNRRKLHDLMLLGYSPGAVARCYYILIAVINAVVATLAVIAMLLASGYWVEQFETIGITSSSPLAAILTAFIIVAVITLINCLAVRRIVRKGFYD
ncbi:MAG: ABC transporter permease, partial [Muribaculaceae bacterium]|nr:ABC transporter permease [Muribaculaceae bacterium]